jgi:hypothetical protein
VSFARRLRILGAMLGLPAANNDDPNLPPAIHALKYKGPGRCAPWCLASQPAASTIQPDPNEKRTFQLVGWASRPTLVRLCMERCQSPLLLKPTSHLSMECRSAPSASCSPIHDIYLSCQKFPTIVLSPNPDSWPPNPV